MLAQRLTGGEKQIFSNPAWIAARAKVYGCRISVNTRYSTFDDFSNCTPLL